MTPEATKTGSSDVQGSSLPISSSNVDYLRSLRAKLDTDGSISFYDGSGTLVASMDRNGNLEVQIGGDNYYFPADQVVREQLVILQSRPESKDDESLTCHAPTGDTYCDPSSQTCKPPPVEEGKALENQTKRLASSTSETSDSDPMPSPADNVGDVDSCVTPPPPVQVSDSNQSVVYRVMPDMVTNPMLTVANPAAMPFISARVFFSDGANGERGPGALAQPPNSTQPADVQLLGTCILHPVIETHVKAASAASAVKTSEGTAKRGTGRMPSEDHRKLSVASVQGPLQGICSSEKVYSSKQSAPHFNRVNLIDSGLECHSLNPSEIEQLTAAFGGMPHLAPFVAAPASDLVKANPNSRGKVRQPGYAQQGQGRERHHGDGNKKHQNEPDWELVAEEFSV